MQTRLSTFAALVLAIAAAGCSGSDGSQGPQGPQGVPGQDGTDGTNGRDASLIVAGEPVVSNATATVSGTSAIVTFNVKVNGVNRDDFTEKAAVIANHNEDAWWVYDVTSIAGSRTKLATGAGSWTIASAGAGNYTATIPNLPAAALQPGAAFMITVQSLQNPIVATVVAHVGARAHDVVGNQACLNCHGNFVWRGAAHDVTSPAGVEACIVCHNRVGSADPRLPGKGTGFMGIVHGVHNSHNMAAGMNVDIDPSPASTVMNANAAQTYTFTWTNGNKFNFSVGFPTYMLNCATCHDSAARLAAVKDAPVSWALCMSCHNDWNGFPHTQVGGTRADHRAFDISETCVACHDGSPGRATVSDFHNGLKTERAGLIWEGADQSIVYGNRVQLAITSVGYDPGATTTLVVTWTAKWDADGDGVFVDVDPCNTVVANGPVFHRAAASAATGAVAQNMSLLRAYALGDDWVNNLSTSSPGQPNSTSLSTSNTSCAALVATTRVKAEDLGVLATAPTKGLVALQGKPQIRFDPAAATSTEVIQVRAKSPTREFLVSTGALPSASARRRAIVSIDRCNTCHPGSMYQHGGNRVDAIELCIMCHNPASNEKNNRTAWGLTAGTTYDGKPGQTYELKTMVHAIHSAGETGVPLVYYRTNGIYAFATQAAINNLPGWKTNMIRCQNAVPDSHGVTDNVQYMVASSIPTGTVAVPTAGGPGTAITTDPANVCSTIDAVNLPAPYVAGTYKAHNEIVVHYPRPLNQCGACHVNGSERKLPDPAKAVATTDADAGAATNATNLSWRNQADDVLRGPVAAACFTCHQSSTAWLQGWYDDHQASFGFTPAAVGRASFMDGTVGENCFHCHDVGRSAGIDGAHR